MPAVALTIAGSDPSGGAGIQADLKTFHQFGVYGTTVVTLITVQNTMGVSAMEALRPELVMAQLTALLEDIPPAAAKTGALGSSETVRAIAEASARFNFPLVVDPVMVSTHGDALLGVDALHSLRDLLVPRAFLVTPNLQEAGELAGFAVADVPAMERAARRIAALGPKAVIVKGGHLEDQAVDVLWWQGQIRHFKAPRRQTRHTHGTGCTFAAAITAELAKGRPLPEAVEAAKQYVSRAIETAPGLGKGFGPVNHHA